MLYSGLILFLTIFAYSVIVSQSFMYIIALKNVQKAMGAASYIELRKLMDAGFRAKFKFAFYAALICNLMLVISIANDPGSLLFICSTLAFLALILDVVLALQGNAPINNLINSWTAENHPADWATYRKKWLTIFQYRQIANITGFTSLLIGAIFGTCNVGC